MLAHSRQQQLLIDGDGPLMELGGLRYLHRKSRWVTICVTEGPHRIRPATGMSLCTFRLRLDCEFPGTIYAVQQCKAALPGHRLYERLPSQFIFWPGDQPAKSRVDVAQDVI